MKLLFTGASGFLGENIKPLLQKNYEVTTIGLSDNDDYKINLAKEAPLLDKKYDIVLHAAGKAHSVAKTEAEKQLFFDVNVNGTKNLCTALENSGLPDTLIFISSVAVYGREKGENITEEHPLMGKTPYAVSKKEAEEFLKNWCEKNNVLFSVLRPSLIAGPNAPGNLGAMVKGIGTGKYFSIGKAKARKSVLMVYDIAHLIPLLEKKCGVYNVCDNSHPSFKDLEMLVSSQLGKSAPLNIPYWIAKGMALIGDVLGKKAPINSAKLEKITESLTFSNEKAKKELSWNPLDVLEHYKII